SRNKILICGFHENNQYSEFEVGDCLSRKVISEYDATQSCRISCNGKQLKIIEVTKLPMNDNWECINIEIAEELIVARGDSIFSNGSKPLNIRHNISQSTQLEFLDYLESKGSKNLEMEEILGRLEVLAISGNERAILKLYSIKNDSNYML